MCGGGFNVELIDKRSGSLVFRVTGDQCSEVFRDEAGGHRWQRIPPTEKRGRVHTSTVTVAVLPEPTQTQVTIADRDLDIMTCRGSGPGGQHRNMTDSAVQIRHRSTGLMVRCESERSQHRNKATALSWLRAKLWEQQNSASHGARASDRRQQIGSGMRGDKRRTIRMQDGQVHDHETGRRWRLESYLTGQW